MRQPNTVSAELLNAKLDRVPEEWALLTAFVPVGADPKIIPRNTNTAATPTQSKMTRAIPGNKKFFGGGFAAPESTDAVRMGRSPAFLPFRMNFGSSVAGAWGTVIFWKHVGHSICVPACDESHLMCWPHTGQAYLNSLTAV